MGDRVSVWSKNAVRTCQNYSKQIVGGDRKGTEIVLGTVDQKSVQDHEFCLRCGRKLKASKARKIGYGPVCERKMQTIQKSRLFDVESVADPVVVSAP